jgi:hypothetical protein
MRTATRRDQAGSALIVAIIFLLLLSTLALAGLRSSTSNVQIVGNMQARQEAQATAQMLIERTISSDEFARNPLGVVNGSKLNPVTAEVNGDTTPDATASLTEVRCLRARPVPLADLDPSNPNDAICFGSATVANPGLLPVAGAPAGSLCADTEWEITSQATDARSGVSVTLSQGVTVRREIVGLVCN